MFILNLILITILRTPKVLFACSSSLLLTACASLNWGHQNFTCDHDGLICQPITQVLEELQAQHNDFNLQNNNLNYQNPPVNKQKTAKNLINSNQIIPTLTTVNHPLIEAVYPWNAKFHWLPPYYHPVWISNHQLNNAIVSQHLIFIKLQDAQLEFN